MRALETIIAVVFGCGLLVLSLFVTAETLLRRLFNYSLQGADELGGYILAVGGALSFSAALIARAHVRIDVFYGLGPTPLQRAVDILSALALASLASLLFWVCYTQLVLSWQFWSRAPSPWGTPLVIPQGLTVAALGLFCAMAIFVALKLLFLLITRRTAEAEELYSPKSVKEEIEEEIDVVEEVER